MTSATGAGVGTGVGGAADAVSLAAKVCGLAPTIAPVYDSAPVVLVLELLALTTLILAVLEVGARFSAVVARKHTFC